MHQENGQSFQKKISDYTEGNQEVYPFFISFTSLLLFAVPAEITTQVTTKPFLGVGGLGGLYPKIRRYAKCHHNGSIYEHGEAVSEIRNGLKMA